jgi:hypothetical protein
MAMELGHLTDFSGGWLAAALRTRIAQGGENLLASGGSGVAKNDI